MQPFSENSSFLSEQLTTPDPYEMALQLQKQVLYSSHQLGYCIIALVIAAASVSTILLIFVKPSIQNISSNWVHIVSSTQADGKGAIYQVRCEDPRWCPSCRNETPSTGMMAKSSKQSEYN